MKANSLVCLWAAGAAALGGMTPVADTGPTSRIHRLASFSIDKVQKTVCPGSNSFACSRLSDAKVSRVVSAHSQVVSGMNYEVDMAVESAQGESLIVSLALYEQSWTGTLQLTRVSVTSAAGDSYGSPLHEGMLALDAAEFEAFLATPATSAARVLGACSGGQVWNDCGSPCAKTCAEPTPMCMAVCEAKCECPHDAPLFDEMTGKCIAPAACHPHTAAKLPDGMAAAFHAVQTENCYTREKWSAEKTAWCCEHKQQGCSPEALAVLAAQHAAQHSAPAKPACVVNPSPSCNLDYHPVCMDGMTYSNRCVAEAACVAYDMATPGACHHAPKLHQSEVSQPALTAKERAATVAGHGLWDSMLLGGAPLGGGGGTLGGRHTGSATAAAATPSASPPPPPTVVPPPPTPVPAARGAVLAQREPIAGGFVSQPAEVHAAGSRLHKLADFSLRSLVGPNGNLCEKPACADMKGATFQRVTLAQTQVVNGINYRLYCDTSAGAVQLYVYERVWTKTLYLTAAKKADGTNLLDMHDELRLDFDAFDRFMNVALPTTKERQAEEFAQYGGVDISHAFGGTAPKHPHSEHVSIPAEQRSAQLSSHVAPVSMLMAGVVIMLLFAFIGTLVARRVVRLQDQGEVAPLRNAPSSDAKEAEEGTSTSLDSAAGIHAKL